MLVWLLQHLPQRLNPDISGSYSSQPILDTATKGYWHLKEYNLQYLNDGEEELDHRWVFSLLAANELNGANTRRTIPSEARTWATRLISRQQSDDPFEYFWSANADGSRPLPRRGSRVASDSALCEYINNETDAELKERRIVVEQYVSSKSISR